MAKVGRGAVDAVLHLLGCSRPRKDAVEDQYVNSQVLGLQDDAPEASDCTRALIGVSEPQHGVGFTNADSRKENLQAALRHLEVRWQLFNEALSKFRDLDSMLATFTDNVSWVDSSGQVISGKTSELSDALRSLIMRNLSLKVSIKKIVLVTFTGSMNLTLDQNGEYRRLSEAEMEEVNACLDLFLQRKKGQKMDFPTWKEGSHRMLLEQDTYELWNEEGEIVENGNRMLLWEEHNDIWYVRGHIKLTE